MSDKLVEAVQELTAAIRELASQLHVPGSPSIILASGSAKARLAHALVVLCEDNTSPPIHLYVSQETLARASGLAMVTVQKELRQLASNGLLQRRRGKVTVLDLDELARIAKPATQA